MVSGSCSLCLERNRQRGGVRNEISYQQSLNGRCFPRTRSFGNSQVPLSLELKTKDDTNNNQQKRSNIGRGTTKRVQPLPKFEKENHFKLGTPPPSFSKDIMHIPPQVHLVVCNTYPLGTVGAKEVPCTKRVCCILVQNVTFEKRKSACRKSEISPRIFGPTQRNWYQSLRNYQTHLHA